MKRSSRLFLGLFLSVLLVACGGGGGGGGGGTPSASTPQDTTPPVTAASPASGTYGSTQSVTLTSNETATVFYSLDGVDPAAGASNTLFSASPLSGINIGGGSTVLKFFAIDTAGNREAIKSATYVVDLVSPVISLTTPPQSPMGLLALATISWQSSKAGSYSVELGGTGTLGTGTQLATGSVAANTPVSQQIHGWQLSYNSTIPVWIYVTDSVGHTGSNSASLTLKPLVSIPVSASRNDSKMLPDGSKAYATEYDAVAVIDTNPASVTYNTVIKTVPVGGSSGGPYGLAVTPNGSRIYVTYLNKIFVISTATDSVAATINLGATIVPTGIAITTDGKRAYFLSYDSNNVLNDKVYILDTDLVSLTYNLVVGNIPRINLGVGEIAMTPDGKKAVMNYHGAVDVIDVDPMSASYNQIIASPIAYSVNLQLGTGVAISSDSAFAYVTSNLYGPYTCTICKINLRTYSIDAKTTMSYGDALALTPDSRFVLQSGVNSGVLSLYNASDLTPVASINIGASTNGIGSIIVTPAGDRAYLFRSSDVVMVPLM